MLIVCRYVCVSNCSASSFRRLVIQLVTPLPSIAILPFCMHRPLIRSSRFKPFMSFRLPAFAFLLPFHSDVVIAKIFSALAYFSVLSSSSLTIDTLRRRCFEIQVWKKSRSDYWNLEILRLAFLMSLIL